MLALGSVAQLRAVCAVHCMRMCGTIRALGISLLIQTLETITAIRGTVLYAKKRRRFSPGFSQGDSQPFFAGLRFFKDRITCPYNIVFSGDSLDEFPFIFMSLTATKESTPYGRIPEDTHARRPDAFNIACIALSA